MSNFVDNFVKIDRSMLKSLGYKYFNNAIKFLRRNYSEGTDFVVQRNPVPNQWGGALKQDLLVSENALKNWMQYKKSILKPKKAENGFVYFIHEHNDLTQFKVGFSVDLKQRLTTLQMGNPRDLIVYKTIPNSSMTKEKEMQDYFASYHIRGEWYRITCDMIDAVCV